MTPRYLTQVPVGGSWQYEEGRFGRVGQGRWVSGLGCVQSKQPDSKQAPGQNELGLSEQKTKESIGGVLNATQMIES